MKNAEPLNMALVAANVAKIENFSATQQAFENIIGNSVNSNQSKFLENIRPWRCFSVEFSRGSFR